MRKIKFLSVFVLLALLSSAGPGAVIAQEPPPPEETITNVEYENPVLGVQLSYPANWRLSQDQYLFRTYGFTLSDEEGSLILRVGWVYDASPEQIEDLVAETIRGNPGIDIQRAEVRVNGYEGVMLSPLPGINPVTCIYLVVDGRVYEIFYGSEEPDAQGWALLEGLEFKPPRQSLASLELPRAGGMTLTPFAPPTDFEPQETASPMAATGCVDSVDPDSGCRETSEVSAGNLAGKVTLTTKWFSPAKAPVKTSEV